MTRALIIIDVQNDFVAGGALEVPHGEQIVSVVLWPDHCVQGTVGAEFHPHLKTHRIEAIFRKGMDPDIDSYSGFHDNGHKKATGLAGYLKERNVNEVFICGLAADFCVFYTAQDALKEGFKTIVIEDATRAISQDDFEKAKITIRELGGDIRDSGVVLQALQIKGS